MEEKTGSWGCRGDGRLNDRIGKEEMHDMQDKQRWRETREGCREEKHKTRKCRHEGALAKTYV